MRSSIEKEDEKREGKMEERAGVGQMNFQSLTTSPRSEATFHDFRSRHHSRSAITQLAAGFYYFFLFFFCTWGKLCRGWARRRFFNEVTRKLGRFQTFDPRDSSRIPLPSSSF